MMTQPAGRTETCKTCRFCEHYYCHRYPPSTPAMRWPPVGPKDFCGEYRPHSPTPEPSPLPAVEILTPGRGD